MNKQEASSKTLNTNAETQDAARASDEQEITRRTFCNRLLVTSSGLLLVGGATLNAAAAPSDDTQVAYPPLKIEGAEALMPGSSLYFNYPSRNDPAILVRNQLGEYYAFGQKCSHLGCSIYFDRNRRCLECPCHRGAFDAQSGTVINGPPTRPLAQIVMQMRAGGQVWAVGRRNGGPDRYALG